MGPWAPSTPCDAAARFDGFPRRWWISGGWAIEASRMSCPRTRDVDVTIFRRDLGALRDHFRGRLDVWAAGSGTLRPLDDQRPRVPAWSAQVWLREHALAPWLLDVLLSPGGPRRWVFKRDHGVTRPIDEATWTAPDGLRYLRPELVLAHKARHRRAVDDGDLAATLPLLEPPARSWLRMYLSASEPRHHWLRELRARVAQPSRST